MNSYTLPLSCPKCGSGMVHGESERLDPDHTRATARCDRCLDLYRVDVALTMAEAWPVDRNNPDARLQRVRDAAAYAVNPIEGMHR